MYEFKTDDLFYDIESLENIFTCSHWYPAQNRLDVFYKMDITPDGPEKEIIENLTEEKVRERVLLRNPNVREKNITVNLKDLDDPQAITDFIKTYGISLKQNESPKLEDENVIEGKNGTITWITDVGTGLKLALPYPIKETDEHLNPESRPNTGYRFGYNSYNYDMSMLAIYFELLITAGYNNWNHIYAYNKRTISAKLLRGENDCLFEDDMIHQMPQYLAQSDETSSGSDYNRHAWAIRKSWLLTGRFIDVARLNDHMRRVGLKRLLGMLGYQILESEILNDKVKSLDELLDLMAYNASDVINLEKLFLHDVYQSSLQNKNQLLSEIPELIYNKKPDDYTADVSPFNVRKDRILPDSSSAKFVETSLCPYKPGLEDIEAVSFLYPDKTIVDAHNKEHPEDPWEQYDVLEDCKKWFYDQFGEDSEPAKRFADVYAFYSEIRGKNVNESDAYQETFGHLNIPLMDSKAVNKLMTKLNTNLFYYDKNGRPTSCFVTFSVGGIHGQEVNKALFDKEMADYEKAVAELSRIKEMYDNDPEQAGANLKWDAPKLDENGQPMYFKNGKPKTIKTDTEIRMLDGSKVLLKKYISGSKGKFAFKEPVKPEYFKRATVNGEPQKFKLSEKYVYTSTGFANHEDFTSYYPLLLTRMNAFWNDNLGTDRYYEFFKERKKYKKMAKDKSYSEEERAHYNRIQNGKKLILNSASGAGDASFDSNIRMNNKVTSMRIIGQLFAWRIGQAQAIAGARVPSTNTDGLYTMDISPEDNDRILNEVSGKMYIGIEPERVDNFISKDSNNRLEFVGGRIQDPKGGTLTSYNGPEPTNNLDHPAMTDWLLAQYLTRKEDAVNNPFDRAFAETLLDEAFEKADEDPVKFLRYMQIILASSDGTRRYVYASPTHLKKDTSEENKKNAESDMVLNRPINGYKKGQIIDPDHEHDIVYPLQQYNRVFLVSEPTSQTVRLAIATKGVINKNTWEKRKKSDENKGKRLKSMTLWEDDKNAKTILSSIGKEYSLDERIANRYEYRTVKIKGIDDDQQFLIINHDLHYLDDIGENAFQHLKSMLDKEAYIDMLENTFTQNWMNTTL